MKFSALEPIKLGSLSAAYVEHDVRVEEVAPERDVWLLLAEVDVHPLQVGPDQRVAEPERRRGELGENCCAARAVVACRETSGQCLVPVTTTAATQC